MEGAERGKLHTSAPAAKPKAGAGEKAVELTELKGAAAVAAAARGLAKVPLDKLAALSPEQLANRLRAEVEVLVGTEARPLLAAARRCRSLRAAGRVARRRALRVRAAQLRPAVQPGRDSAVDPKIV